MKKTILLIVLLLAACFIAGCAKEEQANVNETAAENQTYAETPVSGACEPKWKCIGSDTKAFQLENCSFTDRKECPLGCFNDTCRIKEACVVGFKCKDKTTKGFQTEGCRWISETKCEWKCENAECVPKPENLTEEEIVEVEEPAPAPVVITPENRLALGETVTIVSGGVNYELSIYILEPERVKLKLNTQKSDWMAEGDTATFFGGSVSITVNEILFQSHDEGVKAVVWEEG